MASVAGSGPDRGQALELVRHSDEGFDEAMHVVRARVAAEAVTRPRLKTASDVMASLIPPKRACRPTNGPSPEARAAAFGSDMKQMAEPQIMSRLINWALTDLMLQNQQST